jgi:hypothetical protein
MLAGESDSDMVNDGLSWTGNAVSHTEGNIVDGSHVAGAACAP